MVLCFSSLDCSGDVLIETRGGKGMGDALLPENLSNSSRQRKASSNVHINGKQAVRERGNHRGSLFERGEP